MCLQTETMPSAYITVSRGRKKIKQDKFVYLNNGQEFEIELFNPTSDNLLTKIWINNKPMSRSGIILRPGERVFLERYIDIPKKFLFDTYNVSGGSDAVKKAIEKNGLIKVQFFKEDTTPEYGTVITSTTIPDLTWTAPTTFRYTQDINNTVFGTTSTSSFFDASASMNTLSMDSMVGTEEGLKTSSVGGGQNLKSKGLRKRSKKTTPLETGRVEQGSHSEQTFETVNKKFQSYAFRTVEYQIKPTSTMVMETKQLNTKYCIGCGKKGKPSHKFCSNCGTKI